MLSHFFQLGRYQDVHNQAYFMVLAATRWLGIRLDLLSAILIGAVALAAALFCHDNGKRDPNKSPLLNIITEITRFVSRNIWCVSLVTTIFAFPMGSYFC